MNISQEIEKILMLQDLHEKELKLDQLGDVFEYSQGLDKADLCEGVRLLLAAALQENDRATKESFFDAILDAVDYQNIGSCINWEALEAALPSLEKALLDYALTLFGFSGQENYLPLLKTYAHDDDTDIRSWACEALTELEYRIAHASTL